MFNFDLESKPFEKKYVIWSEKEKKYVRVEVDDKGHCEITFVKNVLRAHCFFGIVDTKDFIFDNHLESCVPIEKR